MLKSYQIKHINGITRVQFLKTPSYSEIKTIIDDIAENFPTEKRLWDFTETTFSFSANNLKSIAEYGKTKFLKPNKLAIITTDYMSFEEMLDFQEHRKQKGFSVTKIFKTELEAITWLQAID
jgi:hypothetical protein